MKMLENLHLDGNPMNFTELFTVVKQTLKALNLSDNELHSVAITEENSIKLVENSAKLEANKDLTI